MDHSELKGSHAAMLEHATWMRKLAIELVRDPGTADDLVQETWLAFLRARPDEGRPLRPWLSRVVRNAAALRLRRGAGRVARESEVAASELLPSAHQLVERAEQQQRLSETVLELDEPYRTIILLRYYEGLTPQQIATAQSVPAATVRSQVHRGLAKLRERLDREHDGDRRAWVVMLQPLWQSSPAGVAASVSAASWLILSALTVGLIWIGVRWTLSGGNGQTLERSEQLVFEFDSPTSAELPEVGTRTSGAVPVPAVATQRRWRLIDEERGTALGDYAVHVDDIERRSDSEGYIELPTAAKSVIPIDDARQRLDAQPGHGQRVSKSIVRAAVALPEASGATELALSSGPTFRLALSTQAAAFDRLEASIVGDGFADFSDDLRTRQVAPVREPDANCIDPWVRFASSPSGADHAEAKWRLILRDDAGLWRGSAPIDDVASTDAPLVPVDLLATGLIEGRVEGVITEQLSRVTVALYATGNRESLLQWTEVAEDGRFALRWVTPGTYDVRIAAPAQADQWQTTTVLASESSKLDCRFEPTVNFGPVAGSITSDSGSYGGQLLVFLIDSNSHVLDVYPTNWARSEAGSLTAEFRFDTAPAGDLRIDVLSLQDAVRFRTDALTIRAPLESLNVRLLDASIATDWIFEVVDATTGSALSHFEVEVRIASGLPRVFRAEPRADPTDALLPYARLWTQIVGGLRWNRFESNAPLRQLPESARFAWTVRAAGYLPASGTQDAFELRSHGPGRLATARLSAE